jgi:Asp-tRNA(Asn)/Glu-tRNA(Gln) amidotransferase A subunit family amidase
VTGEDLCLAGTAVQIAALVSGRQVSAREVATAALRRLDTVDGGLCAFRSRWPDRARRAADAVDRAVAAGRRLPLAGVPIAVKAWDGTGSWQARRLRAAGCVPVGETAVPLPTTPWQTWGHTDRGPTVNPWRPDRTPGGSSAGSAVAVAAGVVPLATGTDGAGSLRIPAAWCGVVGLKPTNGCMPGSDLAGLRVGGPLARTVVDAAAYLDAVLGTSLVRAVAEPGPSLRVVWSDTFGYAQVDPPVSAVARAAADRLAGAGGIEWIDATVRLLDPGPAWLALRKPTGAGRSVATPVRAENDHRLAELFAQADLLLSPTTPGPPHGHGGPGETMNVSHTWVFNLSGHPALSVPAGFAGDGTPVGLQLVARAGAEAQLVRVAAALERIAPWPAPALDTLRTVR